MKRKPTSPLPDGKPVLFLDREIVVDYASVDDIEGAAGDALWSEQRIRVITGLELPTEKHTVMHELAHIVSDVLGIGLKEPQVQALGFALVRLIGDNPHLCQYLATKPATAPTA